MTSHYRHINPSVLLDAADHDIGIFLELSATFLEIAPPMFRRLQQAIEKNDPAGVALESHSLKGTVALVGAEQLAVMLGRIEVLSRSALLAEVHRLFPNLVTTYIAVEQEVSGSIEHFRQGAGGGQ